MKRTNCYILALAICATLLPSHLLAEVPKEELAKLAGTWSVTSASRNGNDLPEEARQKLSVVIKDAIITIKTERRDEPAEIVGLDPSKKPATIDIKPKGEDKTLHGIYKLDGDTLEIAYSRSRPGTEGPAPAPADFSPGEDKAVLKLARQKADAKPAEKKPEEKNTEDKKSDEKKE